MTIQQPSQKGEPGKETMEKEKPNGVVSRVLQFGQMIVLGAVLPWGVWVTGQIYGLQSSQAAFEQWKLTRERAAVATMTDVELARLKTKDEVLSNVATKLDVLIDKVNTLDVKLTRHEAATIKP